MTLDLREIKAPELLTLTEADSTRIEVRLVGSAETVSIDKLNTYLEDLHRVAIEEEIGEVVFDVRALDFMSAACFRSMIAWVTLLQRTPKYRARFVCDSRRRWLRRSLENLASFGGELVRISSASTEPLGT
jgi:hypothetical protein